MADEERKPRKLQVATMRPDDSGRGIARLPNRQVLLQDLPCIGKLRPQ